MRFVKPPFRGENKGHYTAGVISKGMLYVSGQLSPSIRTPAKSAKAIFATTPAWRSTTCR